MSPNPTLPRWHEITAIMGGRFDPPHLGHREAARGLFRVPGVRAVRILPAATPPHKKATVSAEHRAEMARLNFESFPSDPMPLEIALDLRELKRAKAHPHTPSYSYDTLREMAPEFPSLAFVLGTDQLVQFHTWHRFPEILELSHWIVLERHTDSAGLPSSQDHSISFRARKTLEEWKATGILRATSDASTWSIRNSSKFLTICPTDAPAVSSTLIRETVAKTGAPPENTLLPTVLNYLKNHKLYGI